MANAILNFHFDYPHPSLIYTAHLLESETKLALGDALTALALGLLHPVSVIQYQFNSILRPHSLSFGPAAPYLRLHSSL